MIFTIWFYTQVNQEKWSILTGPTYNLKRERGGAMPAAKDLPQQTEKDEKVRYLETR
ncbi:hypothetical protein RP20_CCG009094 [Aedes albopictus]|nr:hypothetical protein RP20_CCG009094 [Aedes albopictus]